jgi:formylglycine-generating enzyme required for sulfatase activity
VLFFKYVPLVLKNGPQLNSKTKIRWRIVRSLFFCFYPTSQPLADTQCKSVNESETQDVHKLEPGESFRDCANCPEMIVIQAGSFEMGDLTGDGLSREKPVHQVTIAKHFAIGKYEITFQQWDACHEAGGCSFRPDDLNWGRGNRAVGDVSWSDAREYVDWLSCLTGADYRLPSESEWEYMARAGSMTRYPWGEDLGKAKARCLTCGAGLPQTLTVGSFAPNDFGVYDTVGSVGEWVEDCLNNSYTGAPSDGSAWVSGQCSYRIVRGGGWYGDAKFQTSSYRNYKNTGARDDTFGIRVARSIIAPQ